jgi:hypothetical protein
MGILRFEDLTALQDALLKERRALITDPDEAGPIGKRACSPIGHTATWIRFEPNSGKLAYGPEIDIEVYRGYEKLLPPDLQQKLSMREIRGWLFQVRESGPNPKPHSFALLDGKEILLSKLPHSRNYFVRRKLRPCKHEKSVWAQVARAWDRHPEMQLADERLDHILQELAVTPFVTFKGCRAAWAIAHEQFDVLGQERFDHLDDYTIAALEIPFEEAYELLKIDPKIQHAFDLTDSGCLFHRYKTAEQVRLAIRYGYRPKEGPVRLPVTDGLFQNRHELMRAACYAALCGREVEDAGDSVVDSAVFLYHRFAHNFVDREKSPVVRPCGGPTKQQDQQAPVWAGLTLSDSFEEKERTRESTAQWLQQGYNSGVLNLMRVIAHVRQATDSEIDEDFVATLRPVLTGWPPGWKRPEGLDDSLQRLNSAARRIVGSLS